MNERIQELSSRARDYAREYVADCKQYGYYMEHNEYDLQFEAKFAELIVLECATYVKNSNCFTFASQSDLCAERLKEHFGVA
jgi:hypothetical protein